MKIHAERPEGRTNTFDVNSANSRQTDRTDSDTRHDSFKSRQGTGSGNSHFIIIRQ